MVTGCLLLVLLNDFLRPVYSGVMFTSAYKEKSIFGTIGSNVTFTWGFSGGVSTVTWGLKNPEDPFILTELVRLAATGSVRITAPASYSQRVSGVLVGNTPGQAIFTISGIEKGDDGFYTCQLYKREGYQTVTQFDHVQLRVEGPPNITGISANQTVDEGNDLTLNCNTIGTPEPNTTWTRLQDYGVVSMPLTNIRRQDEGGYRCTASNGIGNPVYKDVFITVHYKPKVTGISTSVLQDTAIQGENVTLTCHVTEAKPPVLRYEFYRNSSLISEAIVGNFTIYNVRRSQHYGNYTCKAHNDAGFGQSDVIVLDIEVPAEIQWLTKNITVNESSAIDLTCEASGYPLPTITWKKDGSVLVSSNNTLHISSSTRDHSGVYVCVADNSVREPVAMETFVTVHYPAYIEKVSPPSPYQSWIAQTVTFVCKANGVPTPTIIWKRPNGTEVKRLVGRENVLRLLMQKDGDFGSYLCEADNTVGSVDNHTVQVYQISLDNGQFSLFLLPGFSYQKDVLPQ
ncbi:neural cell adhesion molecule 2-like [Montipora capricornis]|uniref:neural cell adhesion molecule 2-like n=1 Tax=Montipora capricornis TaxID=246305 RepID=UPI0035F1F8E1